MATQSTSTQLTRNPRSHLILAISETTVAGQTQAGMPMMAQARVGMPVAGQTRAQAV
jgi:hypothetical protein